MNVEIIVGPSGTGKTSQSLSNADGAPFLYLTFVRRLVETTRKSFKHNHHSQFRTFHRLVIDILNNTDPDLIPTKIADDSIKDTKKPWNDLLRVYIKQEQITYPDYLKNTKTFVVDEYQDCKKLEKQVVKKLLLDLKPNNVKILGDPYQTIYRFTRIINKTNALQENYGEGLLVAKDYFEKIVRPLEGSIETKTLDEVFRHKNQGLCDFISGFVSKNEHLQKTILYDYSFGETQDDFNEPVEIRTYASIKDEFDGLKKIISEKFAGQSVTILTTNRRNFLHLIVQDDFFAAKNIDVETVFSFKGGEAKNIIFAGFELPKNSSWEDINELIYTGITRPSHTLTITTSQPVKKRDLNNIFTSGTFKFIDAQTKHRGRKGYAFRWGLALLKDPVHELKDRLIKSVLDRVDYTVNTEDAPFLKYVTKNNKINFKSGPSENWQTNRGKFDELWYNGYQTRHKQMLFQFSELTPLKRRGASDTDILETHMNLYIFRDLFDRRADLSKVTVRKMDLALIYRFETTQQMVGFRTRLLNFIEANPEFTNGQIESVTTLPNKIRKKSRTDYADKKFGSKNKLVTVTIYRPDAKPNHNRIDVDNLLKVELRLSNREQIKECLGTDNAQELQRKVKQPMVLRNAFFSIAARLDIPANLLHTKKQSGVHVHLGNSEQPTNFLARDLGMTMPSSNDPTARAQAFLSDGGLFNFDVDPDDFGIIIKENRGFNKMGAGEGL